MSRSSFVSFVAVLLGVAVIASCERSPHAVHPSPAMRGDRCEAPRKLPGSVMLPDETRREIAVAEWPERAIATRRRFCNRLATRPGAFAQQHALDAIDWRTWSPETLAEAAALDRPLFVLSGFASCTTCDAFARRSLAGRRLARDINSHFVPVLVDRDQRPDIDAYLTLATEALTGGAGWPAIVFLDAGARPFEAHSWGAAAREPKTARRIVAEVTRRILLGGGVIPDRAESTIEKMQRRAELETGGELSPAAEVSTSLRSYLATAFDAEQGSFGTPPLFPRAPQLEFLLRAERGSDREAAQASALAVLRRIVDSPLVDGDGGVFRFAAAAGWQSPSREKLLADNAALASVLLEAAELTQDAELKQAAASTLDFLVRDLGLPSGGFAAGIAMDRRPCRDEAATSGGDCVALSALRDDRVLADANAVAISAFVRGAVVLGEPKRLDAARAAGVLLDTRLRDGGRVFHCLETDGSRCGEGYLADAALSGLAFLDLADASAGAGRAATEWLGRARAVADELSARFGHASTGGFFQAATESATLPLRLEPAFDAATACGNSAAALLLTRLAARSGRSEDRERARRAIAAFANVLRYRPLAMPSMALAWDEWSRLPQPASEPPQLDPAPAVHP